MILFYWIFYALFCYFIGLSFLLSTVESFAEPLVMTGSVQHQIPVTHASKDYPNGFKEISVLEYEISDLMRHQMYRRVQRRLEQQDTSIVASYALPKSVQLGMAKVPVFDQGLQGTCATFAATAAIDAALGRGDYVSQLCLLQLNTYLGDHMEENGLSEWYSGWMGNTSISVLTTIEKFGIISKENQHRYTCGGVLFYPYLLAPAKGMTLEEYKQHNEFPLQTAVNWQPLLEKENLQADPEVIQKIKTALNSGSRVVIGTLLPRVDLGIAGATGQYHYFNDTWVLTHEIAQDLLYSKKISAHAMVITGYDDEATAIDESGQIHQGLFTLRSSWGYWVGDWGNFYMSYDYAQTLIGDSIAIGKMQKP